MRGEWKMFLLKLYTSKTWGNGNYPGRIIGPLMMFDVLWVGTTIYKIFYQNKEWKNSYLIFLCVINGFFVGMFTLLTIHSIFKEKKQKEFWELTKKSLLISRKK